MKLISQELMNDIDRERQRQEAKFPGQVLPATAVQRGVDLHTWNAEDGACVFAGVSRERSAKVLCDRNPDWSRIIAEEVSETIAAAGRGDATQARIEAIQVAASVIRFIDAIDRGEVGFDA